jgi:hypothetical protein
MAGCSSSAIEVARSTVSFYREFAVAVSRFGFAIGIGAPAVPSMDLSGLESRWAMERRPSPAFDL